MGDVPPSLTEMGILIGSFCWFCFWFLLFTRLLPPVAISELKEVLPPPLRFRRAGHQLGGGAETHARIGRAEEV